MNVIPNEKFITWYGFGISTIAVFDQINKRFSYIQSRIYSNGNMWCYNYIDSKNIYYELIKNSTLQMTLYKSQINYDPLNPSSTTLTLISTNTISSLNLNTAAYSKS